ncbi:MAG: hypothetical protein AAFV71_27570 [Cyanobacteria bacterium J06633_8]
MFPGQPLNQKKFDYDTSSYTSVLTKPWLVEEEEFRLSDQLFDLSPIIQATNGKKLSSVYQTLLNNYLPKLNELAHYFKDRAGLAGFLLEDSGKKDENGQPLTRIDLCKKLYNEYLVAKNQWEDEKRNKLLKVKADSKNKTKEEADAALDDYANWHSSIAAVKDAELDNLYNDLVITGHFHEVMTLLGYLNAASVAEELEKSKQKIQHSQRMSLDESMDIFPVQFIPNNWAKALTPNLHPEDLTMSQDVLVGELRAKRKELSRLKEQLRELELLHVSEDQVTKLEQEVAGAKEAFNKAEGDLIGQYGQSAIDAVKIYLNAETGGTYGLFEGIGNLFTTKGNETEKPNLENKFKKDVAENIGIETPIDTLKDVAQGLVDVYSAQKDTIDKAKQLTELQGKLAQYKSQNMDLQKERLKEQITSLQADVDYVGAMVPVVYARNKKYKDDGQYQEFNLVTVETTQDGKPAEKGKSGTGTNAQQKITIDSKAVTGTFKLKFGESKTEDIDISTKDPSKLQTELEKIASLSGNVTVTGDRTNGYTIDFKNNLENQKVEEFKVDLNDIHFQDSAKKDLPTVIDNRPSLNVLPQKKTITAEDGLFTDITISIQKSQSSQQSTQKNTASNTSWNVSAWFASGGDSSNQSSGVSEQEAAAFESNIEIGFRVAKVTFDRGWFNPQIFDLASNGDFHRLSELRAGSGITKASIDEWQKRPDSVLKEIQDNLQYDYNDSSNKRKTGHYMLPAYPVAMIIAKDITFKIEIDASQSNQLNKNMQESSSYGGGFLCFDYSHASSSSSSSQSTYHGQQGNHYYIRVPGPQILGYTLQLVPEDNTELKPSLTGGDDKLTFVQALQDFDSYAHKMFPHGNGNGNGVNSLPGGQLNLLREQPHFDIIGLTNDTEVGHIHPIGGIINDTDAKIYVITHVVDSNIYYVDGPSKPNASGEWSCSVSFGRAGTDAGRDIEVRAVANPHQELTTTTLLSHWPESEQTTDIIKVKRYKTLTTV